MMRIIRDRKEGHSLGREQHRQQRQQRRLHPPSSRLHLTAWAGIAWFGSRHENGRRKHLLLQPGPGKADAR